MEPQWHLIPQCLFSQRKQPQLRNVREWRVAVLSTNKTAEKKCERIKVPLVKMLATTSLSCQTWRKKKQRLKLINSFRLSATSAPQSWGSFSAPFVFPPVNQMSQTKFLLATPFLLKGKGAVPLLCASMAFDGPKRWWLASGNRLRVIIK